MPEAIRRATQLFTFLEEFAKQRLPKQRTLAQQIWTLALKELPEHPSINLTEVFLGGADDEGTGSAAGAEPLLRVKRPVLTKPPRPPAALAPFLNAGWENADGSIVIMPARNREGPDGTVTELFEESTERVAALAGWRTDWEEWSTAEMPAVRAMAVYSRLYELRSRMALESEQVELVIGDGRLRWARPDGQIDHPVLLQRVELQFDTTKNEFRVVDADRPPELYTTILDNEFLTPEHHKVLRVALEDGGFHPLAGEPTSGFLRSVVGGLGPSGEFTEKRPMQQASTNPVIGRDPYLILRTRPPGFAAAFRKILDDLEHRTTLPTSLTRVVGVDTETTAEAAGDDTPPWGAPADVLLSKPANAEQVNIARALERNHAVQVQGPPGTGKSHTIANLIGHLVAQGKRVLVTSHATKALEVLRDEIVDTLRPLCVSVLDNDAAGRSQLESSIAGILTRLTASSESSLEDEVGDLAVERVTLNGAIAAIVKDLHTVRLAEYEQILVGGESFEPADASKWVRTHREGNDWLPRPIEPGAPLPLRPSELAELYQTSTDLTPEQESEIAEGLPSPDAFLSSEAFITACSNAAAVEPSQFVVYWQTPPAESQLEALEELNAAVSRMVEELERLTPWQSEIVATGHGGGTGPQLWEDLARMVEEGRERWERSRPILLEYAVEQAPAGSAVEHRKVAEEIRTHLLGGGSLGFASLLFKGRWKPFIAGTTVNGGQPSTAQAFDALATHFALVEGRARLETRWDRLGGAAGLPRFSGLSEVPEPRLAEYAAQFDDLLAWWGTRWPPIERMAQNLGLRWGEYRTAAIAAQETVSPFERDASLLRQGVQAVIGARTAATRAVAAERLLAEAHQALADFTGPICNAVRVSVVERNPKEFATSMETLRALEAQVPLFQSRGEFLKRLKASARTWAAAIHRREGQHGLGVVPGDAVEAWRWAQLEQEIVRRSDLDEVALAARLKERHDRLRETTASLIDRKAWLGQKRRVGLKEQQALNGWAQLQKRIGKGTGRRAPALQAQARKMLVEAQGAVPVWIMSLARVAESVDPVHGRFDVVIIDEASQCDITGLLAWYLADKVVVVGDDKQVSPMAVGQKVDDAQSLINRFLHDVPNHQLYDGQASLYDLAQQAFGGTIRLREHFRCMPDIIEFSNALSYDFEIQPLRNPNAAPGPHVVEYAVSGAARDGKTNLLEAQTIAATIAAVLEQPEYADKTLGAISLLGDEQAHLIRTLTAQIAEPKDLEDRRFLAGNSAQFQGDQRHLMFLSLVDTPRDGPLPMRQEPYLKQRYNVAASRARDQLWVFHSLDPSRDLKPGDLRRELIEYIRNPGARGVAAARAAKRAESPFELEVIHRLVAKGYGVEPQVKVGSYRIDMVVKGGGRQVALECDGARWHPPSQVPADLARQAILERCGWEFVRIRSTAYFADPDRAMAVVFDELTRLGIVPDAFADAVPEGVTDPLVESVRRRAWEIMREKGWIASQLTLDAELVDPDDSLELI